MPLTLEYIVTPESTVSEGPQQWHELLSTGGEDIVLFDVPLALFIARGLEHSLRTPLFVRGRSYAFKGLPRTS